MLSQARLKRILFYNPKIGIFTWKVSQGSVRARTIAGYIQHGYRIIRIGGKQYRAGRLAFLYMTSKFPREEVDHRNRIKNDEAWDNLRDVSHSANQKNHSIQNNNTSGIVGVRRRRNGKKGRVKIGKKILGTFKSKLEAIQIRQEAEKRYGYL